jgi:hypothetical protein
MGTCSGTVEAEKPPVLSPHRYTYSIPGGKPSKRDARGRNAKWITPVVEELFGADKQSILKNLAA